MEFQLIVDKNEKETVVATVHQRSELTDRIEKLVMQYTGTDRIPGYTEDDVKLLTYAEIECITVRDGKTYAVDRMGVQYRLRLRLYEVEKMLPSCFVRINKSSLANENRLEKFTAGFGGAVDAVFRSGYREYVSRRCFTVIRRRFDVK